MTIDEAIENEKELSEHCKRMFEEMSAEDKLANKLLKSEIQYHEQLAEWLEELKAYRVHIFSGDTTQEMLKEQYNNAIDDLSNTLKENYDYLPQILSQEVFGGYIDEYAEQLKAGGKE